MKDFVYKNKVNTAIILFLVLISIIHNTQPSLLYDDKGGFREFGVGFRHKTIIPIWLVSIILGILSYVIVLSYLAYT